MQVQKKYSLVGYSAFNRGIKELNGAFGYFDLLRKGRAGAASMTGAR